MFRQILVPLDGSRASFNALAHALQFSKDKETVITALCVIDSRVSHEARLYLPDEDDIIASDEIEPPTRTAAIYQNWAQQIIARAQTQGQAAGVQIQSKIISGIPYQEIITHSSRYDLLVMGGRKSATTYPGPFLDGNTLQYVVTHTHLPALCVFDSPEKLKTILVAYNDSRTARDALQLAATLCRTWGLTLIVLTVQPEGRQAQRILHQARRRAAPVVPRLVARDGDPAEAILNIAATYNCDLIVMGVHAQSPFRTSFGKVSSTLLHSGRLPVLLSH
jgi:nucleotide-binding universal stress UspA family protein